MLKFISKTSIGYAHIGSGTVCQDYSASYHDEERTIVTACDGHGGKIYIRSNMGSKYASQAVMSVFQNVRRSLFYKYTRQEICEKIKLGVLCEWNALAERDVSEKPFTKKELEKLGEEEIFRLKGNFSKAYGTTLNGAMVFGNKLICINVGDGGVFALKKGEVKSVFEETDDDETVANLTYSMCSEDAYKHINVKILDFCEYDGVLICTDGVVNPYQNMNNFAKSFAKPMTAKILADEYGDIDRFIEKMGTEIGIGDDVSCAMIVKSSTNPKNYRR